MTAVTREVPARAVRGLRATWMTGARTSAQQERRVALGLGALALLVVVLVALWPDYFPFTSLTLPLVLGSVLLGPRTLPWLVGAVLAADVAAVLLQDEVTGRILGAFAIQVVLALIVLAGNSRRSSLGVAGAQGERMFVDLRDRILTQSGIPDLPAGWSAEAAVASAGGTPFAGDFVLGALADDGDRLSLVLVDVSGKGEEAGIRALMLSGAMSGLLLAVPPRDFLPAANDYLMNHGWDEGFATAVHVSVDLVSGRYEVRSAGHPPPAQRDAGSGRWQVLATEGAVLGVLERSSFPAVRGRLGHGDTLLLYTDGVVEDPSRDIELGIDRMLGRAEGSLRGVTEGAARKLLGDLGHSDDDRALIVVSRT